MEPLDIKLDGTPLVKAMEPVLDSLKELRGLLVSLDKTPTSQLSKEIQTLKTSAVTMVTEMQKVFKSLPDLLSKEVTETSRSVGKKMRKAGEDAAKEFTEGQIKTVREEKRKVQAEYQALVAEGSNLKLPEMRDFKARGASLFPSDAEFLKAANDAARASSGVLAVQRRANALEAAELKNREDLVKRATSGLAKFRAEQSAEELAEQQKSSNLTFRARQAFIKAEEKQVFEQDSILKVRKRLAQEEVATANSLAAGLETANARLIKNLTAVQTNKEKLRAASASNIDVQTLLGLPTQTKSAKGSFAVFKEAEDQASAAAALASKLANNAADEQGVGVKGRLRTAQKGLNDAVLDGRGAARGLASAFDSVYLTYGRLIPLLAGAALGNAFTSVVRIGAEVNNTLATIRVLSEETGASVAGLNKQMLELARTGPFGPIEVANAMKTLSLAGLSASQVSSSIKDVLNFAVAGNTTLQKSADVLTSVSTAFKISAEGYNYVGDVIAKTAAVSKSSVESIGEAFKTASVINSQYGVSLEDVALGLAALSNVGIQGSAAGTALRNTYADLYGRSEQASKALKKLGLDARDSVGNIKPMVQIISELADKLGGYTKRGQDEAIKSIFSERGAKEAIELLSLFQQKSKEAKDTASNLLLDLQMKTLQSAGFVIAAAAQLSLTPLNQMKSVKAALEATLAESFDAIAPQLLLISSRLKETFGGEEFKNAVQNLAIGFANLTAAIANNLTGIALLAGAWLAYKVAVGTGSFITGMVSGLVGLSEGFKGLTASKVAATTATQANTLATAAGSAANVSKLGTLGRLAGFLGPVGALIGGAATAWELYSLYSNKAKKSGEDISGANGDALLKYYQSEKKRLDELNEALLANITLEDLRARKTASAAQKSDASAASEAIKKAEDNFNSIQAKRDKLQYSEFGSTSGGAKRLKELNAEVETAKTAIQLEKERADSKSLALQTAKGEMTIAAQVQAELAKNQAALNSKKPTGSQDFDMSKPGPGAGIALQAEKSQLKNIEDAYALIFKATDRNEREKQNKLRYYADLGLLTEAEYLKQSMDQSEAHTARRLELLESEEIAINAQLKAISEARNRKAATKENQALADAEANSATNLLNRNREETEKLKDDREQRRRQSEVKALKAGTDIINNAQQELSISRNNLDQDLKRLEVKTNLEQMSERDKFIAGETLKILGAQQDQLVKQEAIRERLVRDNGLDKLDDPNNGMSDAKRAEMRAFLAKLDASIGTTRSAVLSAGAEVQVAAAKAFDAQKVEDYAKDLKTKLADALLNAGKDGGKGMRDYIQNELLRKPFRMVIEAILDPITKSISASVLGALGVTGSSSGGGLGSLLNGASSANSLWGALSGAGLGSTASGLIGSGVGAVAGPVAGNAALAGALGLGEGAAAAAAIAAAEAGGAALTAATIEAAGSAAALGSTLAAAAGPIGLAVAAIALLPSIGSALFGGRRTYGAGGIEGKLGMGGFSGQNFRNYTEDGGWFGSDSSGKDYSPIDSATQKTFSDQYAALQVAASSAASSLGLSAEAIKGYSQDINLTLGSDAKANSEAIAALFASVGDNLAEAVAPGLTLLKKGGESSTVALARLSISLASVNTIMAAMRMRLFNVGLAGADAASKLIDAFGGLEQLSSASKAYYETYYSEVERAQNTTAAMAGTFAALNLAIPQTKAEFRFLVDGLNLNTDAGRAAYVTLLKLAPEFAAKTEMMSRFAKDAAEKILATFTVKGRLSPALNNLAAQAGLVTSKVIATGGELGNVSELFLQANSGLISFGGGLQPLPGTLTEAQIASMSLVEEIDQIQRAANDTTFEMAGLARALDNVDTETFMNVMDGILNSLAARFKQTLGAVANERVAVRNAILQIIGPTVLSREAIARGIAGVGIGTAPGNAALLAARGGLNSADALVAQRKSALEAVRAAAPVRSTLDNAMAGFDQARARLTAAQTYFNHEVSAEGGKYGYWSRAGYDGSQQYNDQFPDPMSAENRGITAGKDLRLAEINLDAAQASYKSELSNFTAEGSTQLGRVAAAEAVLTQATQAQASAALQARAAQLDYIASLQDFSVDASKSVSRLTQLREETVKYYEAQKQLATLMTTSAKALRDSARTARLGQLDSTQSLAQKRLEFATNYSMALATSGADKAGYADKLTALLPDLSSSLMDVAATRSEWAEATAQLFTQSETIASLLDATAPVDYQTESLNLLEQIDAALAGTESSTKSAEKIIAEAVTAGADKTANGLRAVIAALTGQAIPGFATGGDFPGGLRIVGENGPEIEATGPSRIFNAEQTRGMLAGGGQRDNGELVAEIRAVRAELEGLRIETRAVAGHTSKTSRTLSRAVGPAADGSDALRTVAS